MATKQFNKGGSARNPTPSKTSRKRAVARTDDKARQPDLAAILGNFADARAVMETACRSLENRDDYTEETSALRTGLQMFGVAYDRLDMAINRLSRSQASAPNGPKD